MTLTALVGALVALVARPKEPQRTKDQEEIERLKRSKAQLVDRIETLELENEGLTRELAAERNLLTHWIGEAARFARDAREQREQSSQALYAQYHTALRREMMPQQQGLPKDHQFALTHNQQFAAQQAQQMLAQSQSYQQNALGGFCNCVPSRGQVFDAMVEQLNQLGR